jgi:hypothetical protein
MQNDDGLSFVIPTRRLRDVGETVEEYDEHFWRNGHSPEIIVFDDSTPANQEKYFPLLEKTKTHQDLYYVGPREKEQFLSYLNSRLRDKRLESLVRSLFRPSYGGNRNYTLMHTLGGFMVSSDDDMRPYCMVEYSPESLGDDWCRALGSVRFAHKDLLSESNRERLGSYQGAGSARKLCQSPSYATSILHCTGTASSQVTNTWKR